MTAAVRDEGAARQPSVWMFRIRLLLRTLLFWVLWFTAARGLFYGWHWSLLPAAERSEVAASFLHGARMDLATASYIAALTWLVLVLTVAVPMRITRRMLGALDLGLAAVVTTVMLTDLGTFPAWRRRLDASLWTYLATPNEAYASASSTSVVPLVWLLLLLVPLTWWAHRRFARGGLAAAQVATGWEAVRATTLVFATGALLAIPIRGGIQWTPINESTVAFSHSAMANDAAQNPGWTLIESTISAQHRPVGNPYAVLPDSALRQVLDSLYATPAGRETRALLRVARPNVVLIVWESFTAKVVARLGGRAGVTPQFDRWSHQGVLFDSLFASGERSAQGLVSLLSGFPSVPTEAIMNRAQKAASLPQLGRQLHEAGYRTSYTYGGELAFANMKSYLLRGGFDTLAGIEVFDAAERNSKWGAHDHVVLGRTLTHLRQEARPFFATVFTLSSHEPFEVPVAPVFAGRDESTQFLNAHHYTDASVGAFLDSASRQPWWDSTLVVIVADHGSPLPIPVGDSAESLVRRHHIPMLWVGGALRVRDTVVHRIGGSVDVAPTLLAQLGVPATGFRWGRDLLRTGAPEFAYFAHDDAVAYIDRQGFLVYDERARRVLERSAGAGPVHQRNGSALLQGTFADYLAR